MSVALPLSYIIIYWKGCNTLLLICPKLIRGRMQYKKTSQQIANIIVKLMFIMILLNGAFFLFGIRVPYQSVSVVFFLVFLLIGIYIRDKIPPNKH